MIAFEMVEEMRAAFQRHSPDLTSQELQAFEQLGAIWKSTLAEVGLDPDDEKVHATAAATLGLARALAQNGLNRTFGFDDLHIFMMTIIGSTLPVQDLPPDPFQQG